MRREVGWAIIGSRWSLKSPDIVPHKLLLCTSPNKALHMRSGWYSPSTLPRFKTFHYLFSAVYSNFVLMSFMVTPDYEAWCRSHEEEIWASLLPTGNQMERRSHTYFSWHIFSSGFGRSERTLPLLQCWIARKRLSLCCHIKWCLNYGTAKWNSLEANNCTHKGILNPNFSLQIEQKKILKENTYHET